MAKYKIFGTTIPVIWLDVDFCKYGNRLRRKNPSKSSEMQMARLSHDFIQFCLDNCTLPVASGSIGPNGFSGAYDKRDIKKIVKWLTERGVIF